MYQWQWPNGKETDPENLLTNEAMIAGFSNLQKIQSTWKLWNIGTRCKSFTDLWESFILKVFVFFENAPSEWQGNQGVQSFSTLQIRLNTDFDYNSSEWETRPQIQPKRIWRAIRWVFNQSTAGIDRFSQKEGRKAQTKKDLLERM